MLPTMAANGDATIPVLLQPLLDMLHHSDHMPRAVVRTAASLAASHPDVMLPEACAKLASRVSTERTNAARVLLATARLGGLSAARGLRGWDHIPSPLPRQVCKQCRS